MRIHLDGERCTGHGRCYSLADSLFDSDEEGCSVLRADVLERGDEVPPELEAAARQAALNCPERAITLSS